MNRINTQGIILSRTNFDEAARIITFLTPDHGKVSAIAKGVRKSKSKLAGALELFGVSEATFLVGRGEVYTLMSARLLKNYGNIVKDLNRTNAGYEFIKLLDKNSEDQLEAAYFDLLKNAFAALDDEAINLELIQLWFNAQLLKLAGHTPNLRTDSSGQKLQADKKYKFSLEAMSFEPGPGAHFGAAQIKFLRLVFGDHLPSQLHQVQGFGELSRACQPPVQSMLTTQLQI